MSTQQLKILATSMSYSLLVAFISFNISSFFSSLRDLYSNSLRVHALFPIDQIHRQLLDQPSLYTTAHRECFPKRPPGFSISVASSSSSNVLVRYWKFPHCLKVTCTKFNGFISTNNQQQNHLPETNKIYDMYYRLNEVFNVLSDIKSDITSKDQSYFSAEL